MSVNGDQPRPSLVTRELLKYKLTCDDVAPADVIAAQQVGTTPNYLPRRLCFTASMQLIIKIEIAKTSESFI